MRSDYITREGRERLQQELEQLWRVKRPQVTQAVAEAAALGDRSENAEYKEGKRLLREIDRRVRYLSRRLERVKVVEYAREQEGRVWFGAWVSLENESGEKLYCRIVGADEIDAGEHFVSINSPVARAIVGKQVDDEVTVITPQGLKVWWITRIAYRPFDTVTSN